MADTALLHTVREEVLENLKITGKVASYLRVWALNSRHKIDSDKKNKNNQAKQKTQKYPWNSLAMTGLWPSKLNLGQQNCFSHLFFSLGTIEMQFNFFLTVMIMKDVNSAGTLHREGPWEVCLSPVAATALQDVIASCTFLVPPHA